MASNKFFHDKGYHKVNKNTWKYILAHKEKTHKKLLQIDKKIRKKINRKLRKEYKQTSNRSEIQMAKLYENMLKFMSS